MTPTTRKSGEEVKKSNEDVKKKWARGIPETADDDSDIDPRVMPPVQNDLLWEWEAPTRPFKQLNREVFTTILAVVFLLGVILFVIDGVVPVLLIISIVFFWYVSGTVRPGTIVHRLTTWGIESENKLWIWDVMTRYWFEGEADSRTVVIELNKLWPRHLRLVMDSSETEQAVDELLVGILVKDQPKPNWLEKAGKWLETKIKWSAV